MGISSILIRSAVAVLFILPAATVHADTMRSVTGTVVEAGETITIQTPSNPPRLITFSADIPRYEITTGLIFAGDVTKGQAVRLVYSGAFDNGAVKGEYLLFNPGGRMAADINTLLALGDDGAFVSENGQYRLYADADTAVTDSRGRKAELRAGQYILGWFRESVINESAVLSKAVILNLFDGARPYRQIKITDTGDVLLDDGPIARLNAYQAAYCQQYNMAPIRPIAEALGYTVEWEPNQTIHIISGDFSINFNINDDYYQLNDKFVYFTENRFIILSDQIFADYSVIDILVNRLGGCDLASRPVCD